MSYLIDPQAIVCAGRAADRQASILHHELARGTASLKAITVLAPLLGAFATARAMISVIAWYLMPVFDRGERAGGGPAEAFVCLAMSLAVAVVAYTGFYLLRRQVETFDLEMRVGTCDLLNCLARPRHG